MAVIIIIIHPPRKLNWVIKTLTCASNGYRGEYQDSHVQFNSCAWKRHYCAILFELSVPYSVNTLLRLTELHVLTGRTMHVLWPKQQVQVKTLTPPASARFSTPESKLEGSCPQKQGSTGGRERTPLLRPRGMTSFPSSGRLPQRRVGVKSDVGYPRDLAVEKSLPTGDAVS